jgi:hypothetical protein
VIQPDFGGGAGWPAGLGADCDVRWLARQHVQTGRSSGLQALWHRKRLVEQAHAWLQTQGCLRVTALVEADHEYATGFWESAGYTCDAEMRRYSLNLA